MCGSIMRAVLFLGRTRLRRRWNSGVCMYAMLLDEWFGGWGTDIGVLGIEKLFLHLLIIGSGDHKM